jgi:hypothetical protein
VRSKKGNGKKPIPWGSNPNETVVFAFASQEAQELERSVMMGVGLQLPPV